MKHRPIFYFQLTDMRLVTTSSSRYVPPAAKIPISRYVWVTYLTYCIILCTNSCSTHSTLIPIRKGTFLKQFFFVFLCIDLHCLINLKVSKGVILMYTSKRMNINKCGINVLMFSWTKWQFFIKQIFWEGFDSDKEHLNLSIVSYLNKSWHANQTSHS